MEGTPPPDPTVEYCVMHSSYPDEPWRGIMTLQEARTWVDDVEAKGGSDLEFYVARRTVTPWERVS